MAGRCLLLLCSVQRLSVQRLSDKVIKDHSKAEYMYCSSVDGTNGAIC